MPGTQLGTDLTILGILGEGGTGMVYRAEHHVLKREVAVKMCHSFGPGSSELSERLVREARMCASVRDARVPRIYALDKLEDGTPYLVMEKVDGEALSTLLTRGRLHARLACELTCELLKALEAVHRAKVIHRDVKPSNLIINLERPQGTRVRLLDFGIGKVMESARKKGPALTRPGEVVGTPMYMAPEQMTEGAIDPRVDLYAAGVVLYEMLAGRPPFRAPSVAETFVAVLHDEMPKLSELRAGLPEALTAVVHKAAARKPGDRFESAEQMRAALEQAMVALPPIGAGEPAVREQSEEQRPTLVWRRDEALERSTERRYARPLPASLARTLRARRKSAAEPVMFVGAPVGFKARRQTLPPPKAQGGWRVQPVHF